MSNEDFNTLITTQILLSVFCNIFVQEAGRRAFWSINGPRILQVGYEDEEDPKVMEAYERVGALVIHSISRIFCLSLLHRSLGRGGQRL